MPAARPQLPVTMHPAAQIAWFVAFAVLLAAVAMRAGWLWLAAPVAIDEPYGPGVPEDGGDDEQQPETDRAVALAAQRAGIGWEDDAALARLLDGGLEISFAPAGDGQRVLLHGEDVTAAIRTPEISRGASVVSARPVVRQKLLGLQRQLG